MFVVCDLNTQLSVEKGLFQRKIDRIEFSFNAIVAIAIYLIVEIEHIAVLQRGSSESNRVAFTIRAIGVKIPKMAYRRIVWQPCRNGRTRQTGTGKCISAGAPGDKTVVASDISSRDTGIGCPAL